MSETIEISECNDVMRLSYLELILEALGVVGLVIMLLVVLGAIGIIVYFIFFGWEYGIALLLLGIGVTLGLGYIVVAISEFLRTSPSKFVTCPYCGMENPVEATFCVRCAKVLPKYKRRLPRPKYPPKL